jgi:acyl-CoA synthetase (AMP-forming)/AMP-acid ligase II
MTYAQLEQSTSDLAHGLREMGLPPGQRLAILWSNSVEAVQLFLACFKAGIVIVPVDTRLSVSEIALILRDSGASICFSEPILAPLARKAARLCGLPDIHTMLPIVKRTCSPAVECVTLVEDSACLIFYSLGTTSPHSKCVVHTHRSASACVQASVDHWSDSPEVTPVTSLMHAAALFTFLLPTLLNNGMAVLIPHSDTSAVSHAVEYSCSANLGFSSDSRRTSRPRAGSA